MFQSISQVATDLARSYIFFDRAVRLYNHSVDQSKICYSDFLSDVLNMTKIELELKYAKTNRHNPKLFNKILDSRAFFIENDGNLSRAVTLGQIIAEAIPNSPRQVYTE